MRRRRGKGLLGGLALLTMLGWAMPARADSQNQMPVACWFYKYQWAYFRVIHNVWPPAYFSTDGVGTGLMVTDGRPPSTAETEAIIADVQRQLPRGDVEAPPPRAIIQSISRVACPKALDGMALSVAKLWLHQPEIPPEPTAGTGARRENARSR